MQRQLWDVYNSAQKEDSVLDRVKKKSVLQHTGSSTMQRYMKKVFFFQHKLLCILVTVQFAPVLTKNLIINVI